VGARNGEVVPGRVGALATEWRGPGSAATRGGRRSRCGSSAPAPSSPCFRDYSSLAGTGSLFLTLGVSLSKESRGKEDWRRCELSGAGGWQGIFLFWFFNKYLKNESTKIFFNPIILSHISPSVTYE
jgi:hypothetical protein